MIKELFGYALFAAFLGAEILLVVYFLKQRRSARKKEAPRRVNYWDNW
jgi:hypothetical protein